MKPRVLVVDDEKDIKSSLLMLRNEPKIYPQTVILSERLFDYQHYCISNGVIYLEDTKQN